MGSGGGRTAAPLDYRVHGYKGRAKGCGCLSGRGVLADEVVAIRLRANAKAQPEKEAFRFLDAAGLRPTVMSYRELDRRAQAVSRGLRQRGAGGKPVLLAFSAGLDFVAAVFGCFYAGAIAVPVPFLTPQRAFEKAGAIARDCGATLGLTTAAIITQLAGADAQTLALEWVASESAEGDDGEPVFSPADAVALLQYTSGTTTAPKGVIVTHANLMHNFRATEFLGRLEEMSGARFLSWLPHFHDMGLIGFILYPVHLGASAALMGPLTFVQRPHRWLEAITQFRATVSAAPCFAYDLCVRRSTPQQKAQLDLSCWRLAVCGAELVRADVLERFAEAFEPCGFQRRALMPAYGLAEATLSVASHQGLWARQSGVADLAAGRLGAPDPAGATRRLASCGRTAPGHEIAIVDPDSGRRLPDGRIGEIWIQGPSVAKGYWGRAQATEDVFAARLTDDPQSGCWLRSGDLGAFDANGLYITGRRKDILIVRGANYDPFDIEACAASSFADLAAGCGAAFAIDVEDGEAVVLAHEVLSSALGRFDADEAIVAVVTAVTRAFGLQLHDIAFVRPGALPRTTSGKIQRHLCKQRYLDGELRALSCGRRPELGRNRPGGAKGFPATLPPAAGRFADGDISEF